jgi:hypothetical protein
MRTVKKNASNFDVDGIKLDRNKRYSKKMLSREKKRVLCIMLIFIVLFISLFLWIHRKTFFLLNIFRTGQHLVILQNNAELRPTGGFIGSFIEFQTSNFKIDNLYFESNIYKRDNQFVHDNNIVPKDDVLSDFVHNNRLSLRDSNWSADFSRAAKEINWFYKQSGGKNIQTMIGLNTEFFKDILKIIGPIHMVKYDLTVDENNFNEIIQNQVEDHYYEQEENIIVSEPKAILEEMLPIALSRMRNLSNLSKIYKLIFDSLDKKNILIHSFCKSKQKIIDKYNWGGSLVNRPDSDYLHINHANLGINKTSIFITEDIVYHIREDQDRLVSELNIQRKNYIEPNKENEEKGNINFTRIYIPKDSILLEAYIDNQCVKSQIDQDLDFDKKVLRLWTNVDSMSQTNIKIIYQLPTHITKKNYSIDVQKQSGAINQNLEIKFINMIKFSGKFDKDISL